ncbi:hypothetical protein ACKI2N_001295 [Cupriavidus sp. 30B13]|uniref:hypothetical protein n=1 Tax=Cupriavidus sp. 30B13 TaxID=3384241 RepID=UPI003CE87DA0
MITKPLRPWQRLQRRRARGLGLWPALWLSLCLLLAQHAGLTHRVHHGSMPYLPVQAFAYDAAAATDTGGGADDGARELLAAAEEMEAAEPATPLSLGPAGHFCVLFDGATVAASHCGTPALPALTHLQSPLPPAKGWRKPDLPPARPFHTRAPPAAATLA